MAPEMARTVLFVGLGVGTGIWLLGLRCWALMRGRPRVLRRSGKVNGQAKSEALRAFLKTSVTQGLTVVSHTDDSAAVDLPMSRVTVRFEEQYGGAAFAAEATFGRADQRLMALMTGLVLVLTPLVLAGLAAVMWSVVIPNARPSVRWQVVQIVQMTHVLWPPFLVYRLHKKARVPTQRFLSNLSVMLEVAD